MSIERDALLLGGLLLAGSSGSAAFRRHRDRVLRSRGLTGNALHIASDGKPVEYLHVTRAGGRRSPRRLIVCENGLGAALEAWDWVAAAVADDADVLLYHRAGYGATRSGLPPEQLVAELLDAVATPEQRIIYCGHSIGGLIARDVVTRSPAVAERVDALVLVDSTDPAVLRAVFGSAEKFGKLKQAMLLEAVGVALGTSSITNSVLKEVDYRAGVQRAFAQFTVNAGTVRTATAELNASAARAEVLTAASTGFDHPFHTHVISAEYGVEGARAHADAQQALADGIGAKLHTVTGSAHRSILGIQAHANEVGRILVEEAIL